MMITPLKISILEYVARYYTLTRAMLQELCGKSNDRMMRKNLLQLVQQGLLNRTRMEVCNPQAREAPMPVYYPSRLGLEFLVSHTGNESWQARCCLTPNWQHLLHWCTVARFHVLLDQAAQESRQARVDGWYGEWDVIDPEGKTPQDRHRLYTLLREEPKRLVATPDAAFLLCVGRHSKIHYVEIDRHTSSINQICASKPPAYAELAQRQWHRRHFDTTSDSFWVLSVSYTPQRRDLLLERFADRKPPGAGLWKFAAWSELTPQSLLHAPVWHRIEGEPGPLVRVPATGAVTGPEEVRPGPLANEQNG